METAVDFLFKEINNIRIEDECGNLSALEFFNAQDKAFKKAKSIEKEQMLEFGKWILRRFNDYGSRTEEELLLIFKNKENEKIS